MNTANNKQWCESNQQALRKELAWMRNLLEAASSEAAELNNQAPEDTSFTLDFLSDQFQLSRFERNIILLCAGLELQAEIGMLCSKIHVHSHFDYPTFGLAMEVLPEPHWSALTPDSPLRYWQIVHVDDPLRITRARLRLDERILHFLLGAGGLDQRLSGLLLPLKQAVAPLPPSQQQQVERLTQLWNDSSKRPAILIQGMDAFAGREVAAQSCSSLGLQPLLLKADDIPVAADERSLLARLLTREYLLSGVALLIDAGESQPSQLTAFIDYLLCPLILLGGRPATSRRTIIAMEINKPTSKEQFSLWRDALTAVGEYDQAELVSLTAQFDFAWHDITSTMETLRADLKSGTSAKQALWKQCRQHSRGDLDHLAQRITPHVDWDDLVLPKGQKNILKDISRQVHHRAMVYETWGFAGKSDRGLGISALFTGESGTGKTMAGEVLAADLDLDLYRIDLSSVVSKYIGETEKNLARLFSAAESSGAILLFDEADALFGKRSEVKDSHDRYANIELAYLLQRMEVYRGLSILTSNMKSALDRAFMRRIRFVVHFPFPDLAHRNEIWQRVLPDDLPRVGLRPEQLANLNVTGGNIRNIAMNAAFLAAEKGDPLCMADLAHAARREYAKLEKPLSEGELRGWR